jgi:SAM-dependent methyltransferase
MNPWERIYQSNIWQGAESLSGPGSGAAATQPIVQPIVDLIERYRISSVLDVACGDGYWMPTLPRYVGIDTSALAISSARQRHPERTYIVGDYVDHDLYADMIIMRDVLQHCSISKAVELVEHARLRCTYLLASTFLGGSNTGITDTALLTGRAYTNDLQAPPFSLGEPLELIPDGYAYHEGGGVRDPRKFLGLWR